MYQLEKITSDDLFGLSFLYQNEATESICVDSVFALFTQSLRYSVLLERRGTTLTAQTPTMSLKPVLNSTSSSLFSKAYRTVPPLSLRSRIQSLHISAPNNAIPLPITATGPPPAAPVPVNSQQKIRRKLQAALTEHRQNLKNDRTPLSTPAKPADKLKKRFWKDVSVRTDSEGTHGVYLDARPVRNPSTKEALAIPSSKPHLATAIALEWDLLTSAQDTLRSHLLPLTSIASRAHDMLLEESPEANARRTNTRDEIVASLLPYLNTDTILCWAPSSTDSSLDGDNAQQLPSLRDLQIRAAQPIIDFLTTHIWRGVELVPALDSNSILPVDQPTESQAIIRSWMLGLSPWDLVGLERATLAGKSLLVGVRLLVEWSESFRTTREQEQWANDERGETRFGIEAAAEACSVELRWQTGRWGEVEDSHDVEKEDLKRQFGSVVLVVGGTG